MIRSIATLLTILLAVPHLDGNRPEEVVLNVIQTGSRPFDSKAASCLSVFSDGKVIYGVPSMRSSVWTYRLDSSERDELLDFLRSKAVRKLPKKFGPPEPAVDFFEIVSITIQHQTAKPQSLSTREYHVANLEEKARYPSALITLFDEIDRIGATARRTWTPAELPTDCAEKSARQAEQGVED